MSIWMKFAAGLATIAMAALLVLAIVNGYEDHMDEARHTAAEAARAEQSAIFQKYRATEALRIAAAVAEARKESERMAREANQGEKRALESSLQRARADLAAADRAATDRRKLRDDIDGLNAAAFALGIPDAAACPAQFVEQRAAAVRAREMLGSCSAAYTDLAGRVDSYVTGITLKLDTALSYIRAVAPP